MNAQFQSLLQQTFKDPKQTTRDIIALQLPGQVAWMALAAMTLLGLVLSYASALLGGVMGGMANPFVMAGALGLATFILIYGVTYCGKAFGGTGTATEAAALFAWLQVIQNISIGVQVVAALVVPFVVGPIALATVVFVFWLLVNFVSELHRLDSLGKAFITIMLAIFIISIAVSIAMTLAGVDALEVRI